MRNFSVYNTENSKIVQDNQIKLLWETSNILSFFFFITFQQKSQRGQQNIYPPISNKFLTIIYIRHVEYIAMQE